MKTQLQNLILLTTTLFMFSLSGCERLVPDVVEEGAMTPASSYNPPVNPCGTTAIQNLQEVSNDALSGTVEIQNDSADLYVSCRPSQGWMIEQFAIFAGDGQAIPARGGICDVESFPHNGALSPVQQEQTFTISLAGLDTCFDLCVWLEVVQLDHWGNVIDRKELYMEGIEYENLAYHSYCVQSCN